MKKLITIFASTLALFSIACTDAVVASYQGYGDPHRVTCHSGGRVIFDACSTGKVSSPQNSDGYFFNEKTTNQLIEVSGECVIAMGAPCPATVVGIAKTTGVFPSQKLEPVVCK